MKTFDVGLEWTIHYMRDKTEDSLPCETIHQRYTEFTLIPNENLQESILFAKLVTKYTRQEIHKTGTLQLHSLHHLL